MLYAIFGPQVVGFIGGFDSMEAAKCIVDKYDLITLEIFEFNEEITSDMVYIVTNDDGIPLFVSTDRKVAETYKKKYNAIGYCDKDDIDYTRCRLNTIRNTDILERLNTKLEESEEFT